ncbi:MAG: putative NAD-dependent protein-ADP-ribosyltransferase YbiA (DUF1768 family) [Bacteriovoracaceae bacterium]|jgi:predicted NAD-dependent protein-ADP-ribosyltransferase YbiA (DUF1768 family)
MKKVNCLLIALFFLSSCASTKNFPNHWWAPVTDKSPPSWEILPQSGKKGKSVILSKRNELGILSNFAKTSFTFEGKTYPGIEGLWQGMKYPEDTNDKSDPRNKLRYKLKRSVVEQLASFKAKRAGKEGSSNMKKLGINWVTYKGKRMTYRTSEKGEHYQLIRKLMTEKLKQNKEVQEVLMKTGDLILLPDHTQKPDSPPAWKYNQIWMELREEVRSGKLKL